MVAPRFSGRHLKNSQWPIEGFTLIELLAVTISAPQLSMVRLTRQLSIALFLVLNISSVWSLPQSVVQFASAQGEVIEGQACNLRLSIEPPAAEPIVVSIRPLFGGKYTASASDLGFSSRQQQPVAIPAGQQSWSFSVSTEDDGIPEADETLVFSIVSVSGPAGLGVATNVLLTIHNQKAQVSASLEHLKDWLIWTSIDPEI